MGRITSGEFYSFDRFRTGNTRQQRIHATLTHYRVMERLNRFSPVISGTVPLGIDTRESDLDIICCFDNADDFEIHLNEVFYKQSDFTVKRVKINERLSVVANLLLDDLAVEIFGQELPVERQDAFRHMMIEYEILQSLGPAFRKQLIELKTKGVKTEPAFARLLKLPGNPYESLLDSALVREAIRDYAGRASL